MYDEDRIGLCYSSFDRLGQIITSAIGVGNDEDYDCYISFGLRSCIGAGI